jgi:hypothetical protein
MVLCYYGMKRAAARIGVPNLISDWQTRLKLPAGTVDLWVEYSSPFDPVSCGALLNGCPDEVHDVVNNPVIVSEHGATRTLDSHALGKVRESSASSARGSMDAPQRLHRPRRDSAGAEA